MSDPFDATSNARGSSNSVPTSAIQYSTSPWRRQDHSRDQTPTTPRRSQHLPWRRIGSTTVSSPIEPIHNTSYPWNRTYPNSPSLASSLFDTQALMSVSHDQGTEEILVQQELSRGVAPAQSDFRPRLELDIPIEATDSSPYQTRSPPHERQIETPRNQTVTTENLQHAFSPRQRNPISRSAFNIPSATSHNTTGRAAQVLNAMAREFVHSENVIMENQEPEINFDTYPETLVDQEPRSNVPTVTVLEFHTRPSSRGYQSADTESVTTASRESSRPNSDAGARRYQHMTIPNRPRGITHTNSRTWVRPVAQQQARWAEVYRNLKDMGIIKEVISPQISSSIAGSFCVPRSFNEWMDYRTEIANDRAKLARKRLFNAREHKLRRRHPDLPPPGETAPITTLPLGGAVFGDGRSSVLGMHTIWSPWGPDKVPRVSSEEQRPEPMWPCEEEMREEGNERMTSGYRRFPALLRVPGNDTVNWKQKNRLDMLPFDLVWDLPNMQTCEEQRAILSPVDREEMEAIIGHDLLTALDCKTILDI